MTRRPAMGCWLCGSDAAEVSCARHEMQAQLAYLERFHRRRLRASHRNGSDLVDRADFTQDYLTDILACRGCGLVYRRERPRSDAAAATYARDRYGPERLDALFASQVGLFRPRLARLAAMLPKGAEPPFVIEIGSFVGGFLTAAKERGWKAIGIDPGREVTAFCRARGLTVIEAPATDVDMPLGRADAVVIWNTFDQLPAPSDTLAAVRRWLRPGGVFAVRVPNGTCFRACTSRLRRWPVLLRPVLRTAMAWNNLLAFPYLHGYSADTLDRLLAPFGLHQVALHPSVLPRLADHTTRWWAVAEEQLVKSVWRRLTRFDGGIAPWIDAYYRADTVQRRLV